MDKKEIIYTFLLIFLIVIIFASTVSAGFFDWFGKITGHAISQNENITITINGTTGVTVTIFNQTLAGTDPTEDSTTNIVFYVVVDDQDGVGDINDTSINTTVTASGETTRRNNTCSLISDLNSTAANFSCAVDMWYYDASGAWTITVGAKDIGNQTYVYDTATFQFNQLQAITIFPNSLTWATLNLGTTNQTSNNDPTVINNTGNYNIANISIKGLNLHGDAVSTEYIDVGNFSVGNNTGSNLECNLVGATPATLLVNGSNIGLNNATLNKGNHSVNDGTTGQEQLYYCLQEVPTTISSQTYSTTNGGSWIIKLN